MPDPSLKFFGAKRMHKILLASQTGEEKSQNPHPKHVIVMNFRGNRRLTLSSIGSLDCPLRDRCLRVSLLKQFFSKFLVLVITAASIYGIDRAVARLYGEQTLAPVLAILCFGGLIFVGSPRLILVAIPLFAAESYWIIRDTSMYPHIRTVSVVLGGLIAYWACGQRRSLEARLAELDLILAKLQAPWILCDRSGNIRRMSAPAAELAQANFKDLEGTSFFAKFTAGPSKGELIQKFLQTADSRAPVEKFVLSNPENPGRLFDSSFVPVQTREGPGILVILSDASTQTSCP